MPRETACYRLCPKRIHEIDLIEHHEPRDLVQSDLGQDLVHGCYLLFKAWIADIDNMQDQVGVAHLVECGPEGTQKVLRQITDETHGVRDDHFALPRESQPPRCRVERRKEEVLCLHPRPWSTH